MGPSFRLPLSPNHRVARGETTTCTMNATRPGLHQRPSHARQQLSLSLSHTTRSPLTPPSSETRGTSFLAAWALTTFRVTHSLARRLELETRLSQIPNNDAKEREIRKYTKSESQHLRLKRTKIKVEDFKTVKVIGKGAFGEVCSYRLF
jgi:hypothetical protein